MKNQQTAFDDGRMITSLSIGRARRQVVYLLYSVVYPQARKMTSNDDDDDSTYNRASVVVWEEMKQVATDRQLVTMNTDSTHRRRRRRRRRRKKPGLSPPLLPHAVTHFTAEGLIA